MLDLSLFISGVWLKLGGLCVDVRQQNKTTNSVCLGRVLMNNNEQRQQRLRSLVHKLNQDRKRQAQKIDLLCRDLINAQREFIGRLGGVKFTAEFYRSLLGITDLTRLLEVSSRHMCEIWPDVSVTFFIKQMEGFRQYRPASQEIWEKDAERLEHGISDTLAEAICRRGKSFDQDDLLGLGFQVSPTLLNSMSLMTIPLIAGPRCVGFILLYRPGQNSLTGEEVRQISQISRGLTLAMESCEALSGFAQ